jgi:hypothetical protein
MERWRMRKEGRKMNRKEKRKKWSLRLLHSRERQGDRRNIIKTLRDSKPITFLLKP